MKRSITTYTLMLLMFFQAISAIPVGAIMIASPTGAWLGLPITMLEDTPFTDFLIPGLFLFFMLGIVPGIILYGLIRKNTIVVADKINIYKNYHWSWTFSYYIGILLVVWINVQLFFIKGFHINHFIYSMLGVMIIFVTHLPSTKRNYRIE